MAYSPNSWNSECRLRGTGKLLVILPITRNGEEPERAVMSLSSIANNIVIVASFNRQINSQSDHKLLNLLKSNHAMLLETSRRLNPVQHMNFIIKNCKRIIKPKPQHPTTFLCDDDELLINSSDLDMISDRVKNNIATWGLYRFHDSLGSRQLSDSAFYRAKKSLVYSRLTRLLDEHEFEQNNFQSDPPIQGSITGLFAPFGAFADAAKTYMLTLSTHGVKMENTVLSWRGLSVAEHVTPVARIYLHHSQSGRGLAIETYIRSDMRYKFHALTNSKNFSELRALYRHGYSPKWFLGNLLSLSKQYFCRSFKKIFASS